MSDRNTLWTAVHEERRRLADDLAQISADQWDVPSLCPGWTVHDVLAHLVDSASTTRWGFVRQMFAARGDFDRANEAGIERHRAADPRQTLEAFRAVTDLTSTPPGPLATRLVEAYVHGEDVRRPLGIEAAYPPEHVATALEYMTRTGATFGGGRERVAGLCLRPVDTDHHLGEGAAVRGSAISLLLAASGRPVDAAELSGAGAPTLTARLG
ncbi:MULTISPECIES: maleylpyruvate isomerase family mycothiol-dependent enzyme [unclassified Isoptericola]|uniref:maleylpyruvate isomerase family mycothiol-dependent enzyme n=1 Tax=unclassified Isoptericola TaxID=2623355 RepID=UPI002712BCD1|nr:MULTISPECIES: maleylpyruvate isomerase family mycothiol-dependent enzyme [unclassified Isoptericola]MDO8143633.1 maleylpyruvate isomerase family mycothiol-dependent enzyme [Isoptericola sp. 178]MDO8150169.1 maleylpyruvate isomerase family mycothiol-dependent enzyme [Isoptericola sp. b408]